MTQIIIKKWGNSLGVRIPKSVLAENNLQEGTSLVIHSKNGKIILEPQKRKVREGWAEAAQAEQKNGDDRMMMDFPNEFDQEEWTW
jgi:antitoxin component of MazEF toxin-antitoxin module